jgi:C4-dicarboxylate-specific signal transduction histidine kinase
LRLVGGEIIGAKRTGPAPNPADLAHELNNLLDGGMRNLALALSHLHQAAAEADNDTLGRLDAASDSLKQMSGLLHRWMRHEINDPVNAYWTAGSVDEAIRSTARLLRPVLESQRIKLDIQLEARVAESPIGPLQPVLANGLRNALEAIGADGHIVIIGRRTADQIALQICDDGPGIDAVMPRDPDGLPRPGVTTKEAGHGMGLALSRQIVTALGGSMRLADRPEGGATLTLRWSAAKLQLLEKDSTR